MEMGEVVFQADSKVVESQEDFKADLLAGLPQEVLKAG